MWAPARACNDVWTPTSPAPASPLAAAKHDGTLFRGGSSSLCTRQKCHPAAPKAFGAGPAAATAIARATRRRLLRRAA